MKRFLSRTSGGAVLLVLGALLFAGCDDGLVREGSQPDPLGASSKFRHAGLVSRATRGMGKDGEMTGLILKLQATTPVNSLDDLLQRYGAATLDDLLQRYGLSDDLLQRYGLSTDLLQRYTWAADLLQRYLYQSDLLMRYDLLQRYQEWLSAFNGMAVEVPTDSLEAIIAILSQDSLIAQIEPDVQVDPTTPGLVRNWLKQMAPLGLPDIGADTSVVRPSDGVELYIIDSGVSSADLNVVENVEFSSASGSGADAGGHGTHVAGLAAAIYNGIGTVGVAPGARVHNLKVVRDDGYAEMSAVIAAVDYVTQQKLLNPSTPMVVNISLGADIGTTERTALDEAIQASMDAGVVYVVAAGNDGIDVSTVTPAHVDGVITVGAYGSSYAFAPFSNFGAGVDLLAPGVQQLSLASSALNTPFGISVLSGTSMAAGFVSGAAVLYLAQHPSASPAQVEAALEAAGQARCVGVSGGTTALTVWVGAP